MDILLCDLDAFFASVEQRDHPEYRGKPVIVGGKPEARGVVSACSYEARRFGIRSAMPMVRAVRLCPNGIFLPVNIPHYRAVSEQVVSIYRRFTPAIEQVSIDEAYLGVPQGTGVRVGEELRRAVRREVDLPVSVGVSSNKLLAKIACKLAKPDGLKELWPNDVPSILWPLDADVLPGVGPKTQARLEALGIHKVKDLVERGEGFLDRTLGTIGRELYRYALGQDDRGLTTQEETKSISEETTFPRDIHDGDEALAVIMLLSEEVGFRLRRKGLRARTVTLKIRYADYTTITRSITLSRSTCTDFAIYRAARDLFCRHAGAGPWRLLGVQVSGLVEEEYHQLSLLEDAGKERREERITEVIDGLRNKYGKDIVHRARVLLRQRRR
ncbi:MAG TPA: DNA polymerase IV [Clostridia bacterium]|nr:DNA polymerase IV [Clostridia bacterium]